MFGFGYGYGYYMDPGYILVLITAILSLVASARVSSTYKKYSQQSTAKGITAEQAARKILDENGLYNVRIESVSGNLTDHYDPRSNVIRLSDTVRNSSSVAAVGVAAHEAGHAVQHATGYGPVVLRSKMVPITSFASRFTWIIIMLGAIFLGIGIELGYYAMLFGVGLFAVTTVFQLVTLPCEFDASKRALVEMDRTGLYSSGELAISKKVLSAAALTYVAALIVSALQLLRLIISITRRR